VYELTKFAPTSANTQPLRVLYVRKGEARDRLVPHMAGANGPKTASAPVVAILAADLGFHEHIPTVFPIRPEMKDMFDANPALREQHARFNATLQAGYFLLGVRAAGLSAGPMTGFDAEGVDREFFPDGRLKSLVVVNIGHPGEGAAQTTEDDERIAPTLEIHHEQQVNEDDGHNEADAQAGLQRRQGRRELA